jgi:hypothetical protein
MSELCPFCRIEIPDGATVCRGCGADKRPAMSPGALAVPIITVLAVPQLMTSRSVFWGLVLLAVCVLLAEFIWRRMHQLIWVRRPN